VDAVPEIRYVRSGGVNIAYTRWGQGAHVAVYTPPLTSNVELVWESPEWTRVCRRAGEHMQCVMIDKRGVGLSDRVSDPPTLDDHVADTLAVIDAEGLAAVDLVGHSEGGPVAVALAVRFPERVSSMILIDAPVFGASPADLVPFADDDWPLPSRGDVDEMLRNLVRRWATADSINLEIFAPTVAMDPAIRRWYQRFERQSASPGALLGFLRSQLNYDVRPLLAQVRTRTLVMHARHDRLVHVAHGRYLAKAIPGATYLEQDMPDHIWMLGPEWRQVVDDQIQFITGHRPERSPVSTFAVVVFTDIVDSTAREVAVGDQAWRQLLEDHDRLAHDLVGRHGGRIVKHTGDGLLATFTDPASAVRASLELSHELAASGMPIRTGLHAGVIEIRDDGDVSGIVVNIAARVESMAGPGDVLVSDTLRDLLLGTAFRFDDRGEHDLKGVTGARRLYAIS
jgi:class 3 adenylate cyclase/pimeloyl-ACP methyl ester carboxylesterase